MLKKYIVLIALSLSACTSFNGSYSAISNRPINLYDITRDSTRIALEADDSSSRSIVAVIPFDDAPTVEEAVDHILTKYNGDYITDATINHTSFHVLWLYHYSAWTIRGNVMKFM